MINANGIYAQREYLKKSKVSKQSGPWKKSYIHQYSATQNVICLLVLIPKVFTSLQELQKL